MMLWLTQLKNQGIPTGQYKNARLIAHCRGVLVDQELKGVKQQLLAHRRFRTTTNMGCANFRLKAALETSRARLGVCYWSPPGHLIPSGEPRHFSVEGVWRALHRARFRCQRTPGRSS
jgi:hypothetical protein